MTNLTPIEGGKKDPKTKLGIEGGLGDGLWALRIISIMVIGIVPGLVGLVLAAATQTWWWLALCAPFVLSLVALFCILAIIAFVELWNEAWRGENK